MQLDTRRPGEPPVHVFDTDALGRLHERVDGARRTTDDTPMPPGSDGTHRRRPAIESEHDD